MSRRSLIGLHDLTCENGNGPCDLCADHQAEADQAHQCRYCDEVAVTFEDGEDRCGKHRRRRVRWRYHATEVFEVLGTKPSGRLLLRSLTQPGVEAIVEPADVWDYVEIT